MVLRGDWEPSSHVQDYIEDEALVPGPKEVKRIRGAFGLSVADLAALFGVTRQTVHGWERADARPLAIGPAALLLGLLAEEAAGRMHDVLAHLCSQAALRGQDVAGAKLAKAGAKARSTRRLA